ncbi:MAG: M20/M25/M40 family metallo-hydrolase [Oscillospiraceae bacterium]|nr:M20/M25/M40 family metallo-hydrolase [Oscillospiraceae bacterium]
MDEIVAWLLRLIDFDTTVGGSGAEECARFIRRELSARNVRTRLYTTEGAPRRAYHLLAEVPGERRETVMLHAHLDTAGFGARDAWRFPADRGTRRHGCICGRGAIDCKGPLAVWMKLLTDAARRKERPYTLRLLVSDLEEEGGDDGLGRLLTRHPELLSDVKLLIGEGGGFPFPFEGNVYYTFQTGERETAVDVGAEEPGWDRIAQILSMGIEKGYYSREILDYAARAASLPGRRLDIRPLYEGMDAFFGNAAPSDVRSRFGRLFEAALRAEVPDARLMPCITPGMSDNRRFRKAGVPVVGFFPLELKNSLGGIHGTDEYISEASLALAYHSFSRVIEGLGTEQMI